jgi:hypothetical protein
MDEPENKKPSFSKLAVISFSFVILGLCAFCINLLFREIDCNYQTIVVADWTVLLLTIAGITFGIIAEVQIRKRKGKHRGQVLLISAQVIAVITLIGMTLIPLPMRIITNDRFSCGSNISSIGKAMFLYADEYNNTYPPCNQWCDSLKKRVDVNYRQFICKAAVRQGDKCSCHYAMNPDCEPNSPNDVVLLFETKGGWNQCGGPELLTFDNHHGQATVLFNDGCIGFIRPENVGKLKWKAEESKTSTAEAEEHTETAEKKLSN